MIYFDNAATGGFKPYSVQEVAEATIKHLCANPARSGHRLSERGGEIVFNTRKTLCQTFDSESIDRVIFTKNATEALNTALLGLTPEGSHVVTTCLEHNSTLRPLNYLKATKNVDVSVCYPHKTAYIAEKPIICYEDLRPLITDKTALVAINQVSNVNGAEVDVHDVGVNLQREHPNVLLVVDGAQSGGHIPISLKKDCIDALCLAGHKGLMGIMGSGVLILSERANPHPLTFGGTGSDSLNLTQPDFYPDCLESGTLNLPAISALLEGVLYVKNNLSFISDRLKKMSAKLIRLLTEIDGVNVYSAPNRSGIVAFKIKNIPSEDTVNILSERYDVATRGGYHCAPLMHAFLGTKEGGLVRASLSPFNTFKEISSLTASIKRIIKEN